MQRNGHSASLPGRRLHAGLPQHPVADLDDGAALLEKRHELARRDDAALGVSPAQQRLRARHAARFDVDARQVGEEQQLCVERLPQVAFQDRLGLGRLAQLGIEPDVPVEPLCLRLFESDVGTPNELVDGRPVVEDTADAGRHDHRRRIALDRDRHADGLHQALRETLERAVGLDALVQEHDEPVVAGREALSEAGDGFLQAACHDLQDDVADTPAEPVVEDVEVVDIDEQHGPRALLAPGGLERTGENGNGKVGLVDRRTRNRTLQSGSHLKQEVSRTATATERFPRPLRRRRPGHMIR